MQARGGQGPPAPRPQPGQGEAQKGEAGRSLQTVSMRDHQGTNQGGSREGSLQADRGSSKSPELGESVSASAPDALGWTRDAGGAVGRSVGGSRSEGGKPRCLSQLRTGRLMVTAESGEQSAARACSIKNNHLLTSRGLKWQHVPDHLTQLGREA